MEISASAAQRGRRAARSPATCWQAAGASLKWDVSHPSAVSSDSVDVRRASVLRCGVLQRKFLTSRLHRVGRSRIIYLPAAHTPPAIAWQGSRPLEIKQKRPHVAESLFNNQQSIGVGTEAGASGACVAMATLRAGIGGIPKHECSHDASAVGAAQETAGWRPYAAALLVKGAWWR